MNPVENEINSAIRYGFNAKASRSDVFSALFSGRAAILEFRSRKAPEIAEIESKKA